MYKALLSFSGVISMSEGEIREITNKELVDKLINAKFIEKVSRGKTKEETKTAKEVKPKKN